MEKKIMSFREFQFIACEHTPDIAEDSGQPEWCQGELQALYDDLNGKGFWSMYSRDAILNEIEELVNEMTLSEQRDKLKSAIKRLRG